MEWVRFTFAAIFLIAAVIMEIIAVFGIYKFKFVMNRMHSAAIGDTLALLLAAVGLIIAKGFSWYSVKLLLVVFFLWLTSAISSHVIMRMEVNIDEDQVKRECEVLE